MKMSLAVMAALSSVALSADAEASRRWVVNGELATRADLRSTVALFDTETVEPFCTGTLIAPDVVMTAGHCFANEDDSAFVVAAADFTVYVGALDANTLEEGAATGTFGVSEIHVDCGWLVYDAANVEDESSFGRSDDIAFLLLDREVPAALMAPTSLLPEELSSELAVGAEVIVSGYGIYDLDADESGVLHTGRTTVGKMNGYEILTARSADGLGTDSCSGDSGGPLYFEASDGEVYVVGVVSRGTSDSEFECGDGGIYTRPEEYLDLLNRIDGGEAPWTCDGGTPVAPEIDPDPEPEPEPEPEPLVDHAPYDALLKAFVKQDAGRVDYAGLKEREAELDAYLTVLADAPVSELDDDEKYAFYANAYNAFTLKLIVEKYPELESIRDIDKPWKTERWQLAGETVSLDHIEHGILRPTFKDPRVHFAVNCAAIGCPPLRGEAFVAERLDEQLEDSTRAALQNPRYAKVKSGRLYLTKILEWYGKDFTDTTFKGHTGTVAEYVAGYSTEDVSALVEKKKGKPSVRFMDYDWKLNDVEK